MCCGGNRSATVRVARNTPKNKLKTLTNGVIVMRSKGKKRLKPNIVKGKNRFKPNTPGGGVRVARSKRR
jgi:hypothetical protein